MGRYRGPALRLDFVVHFFAEGILRICQIQLKVAVFQLRGGVKNSGMKGLVC